MEMWPRHYGVWFGRLWLLAGTNRYDRALAQIDDAAARPALPPPIIDTLRAAITAAGSKQPAAVGAAVDQVMAGVSRSVAAVVNGMMLLNHLGATDRAFDLARAYYLEQGPIIAAVSWRPGQPMIQDQRRRKTNMLFTPTAAAMRSDPRFMPLMQQMGLVTFNAWALDGYIKVFWRNVPLMELWPQVVVLLTLAAVFVTTARWLARRWCFHLLRCAHSCPANSRSRGLTATKRVSRRRRSR